MANNLFYLDKDNNVNFSAHTLKIKEFKQIWDRDASKKKQLAVEELCYVYAMADYQSEYEQYGVGKEEQIIADFITHSNWKPDMVIERAIKKYKELQNTSTLKHLLHARKALESLNLYYSDNMYKLDMSDEDKKKYDSSKVSKAVAQTETLVETNIRLEKKVQGEEVDESKILGGGKIGSYENEESAHEHL